MRVTVLAAAAALVQGAVAYGPSQEITDPRHVKQRLGKKVLKQPVVIGYLPSQADVRAFSDVSRVLPDVPFYHVHNKAALEAAGLLGNVATVALHRPWAPSRSFKLTHRSSNLTDVSFIDWVVSELFQPGTFLPDSVTTAREAAAGRQNKAVLRAFVRTDMVSPESVKPADWDQPQHIPEPGAKEPEDWDAEEDGAWEAPLIPNPGYKGQWVPKRESTMVLDPTDVEPEGWAQPREIPDPAAQEPEGWDEEEDGPWSAVLIPNPNFRQPWVQRRVPAPADVQVLTDKLKPVLERFGNKLVVVIEDPKSRQGMLKSTPYGFSDEDFASGNAITIEVPKYTYDHNTWRGSTTWLQYKYSGGDLTEWVQDWAKGKLMHREKEERKRKQRELAEAAKGQDKEL